MNNDNDLNLPSMTKLSGWLRYCVNLVLNVAMFIDQIVRHFAHDVTVGISITDIDFDEMLMK